MKKTSEELRLKELESYDLHNGYPKEKLKSIIKLASNICDTPISLIDIIDEYNQRTVVTHGDWEEKVIPREKSICDKAVVDGEMLIIDDVEKNEEIYSRLSTEDKKKIKFYAGAPLKTPGGYNLGALCIIDSEPRQLTDFQKESLQVLADEVMARLHLHKQKMKLEKYSVFLNNSADILCIIDSKTNFIIDINEDCYQELGFTKEELIGKKFTNFLDVEFNAQKAIKSWFKKEKSNKERLSLPVKLINKQSEVKWYRCNFTTEDNCWFLTARNITDQKNAEERVNALHSKFEKVVSTTTDLIYEFDWKSAKIIWSGDLTELFGYPESDRYVDFEWWKEKVHPDDVDEVMNEFSNVVESDEINWSKMYRFRTFDGSYKYVLNNSHIERGNDGSPTIIVGALADITKLKKAELQQKNLLSKLQHANHLAELGFWELDLKKNTIDLDDEILHILDLKRGHKKPSLDLFLKRLDDNTKNNFLEFIQGIRQGHNTVEFEHKIENLNSSEKYLVHRGELIHENGVSRKILMTTQDISDRKVKELRITESLHEKEVLLSEIHHRVKNNLAIISGLLELNSLDFEENGSTFNFIRSSQLRIKSMAKIHEKLYQSDSFTHISFSGYILELLETIRATMKTNENEPEIITSIEDVQLNINYAIPCGLLLNELITNSWKHAFPDLRAGTIRVSFYSEDEKIHLVVEDDGIGLPEGFEKDNASMGMTLIRILSKQIEAQLSIENKEKGVLCKLTFLQEENRKGSSSNFV